MALILHILIALGSIGYSTYLFVSPADSKFKKAYLLVASTILSGTYLVVTTGTHLVESCLMGIIYLGATSALIIAAQNKLSVQKARK